MEIDYVRKKNFRKEDKVKTVLKKRGTHPGLVWIFSALEPCTTYQPWHDKKSGRTYLRYDDGKCLHSYFYFIDEELGLGYVRVPTWCPFRLPFYCHAHNWLARQLDRKKIRYTQLDNAFTGIEDWAAAQALSDSRDPSRLFQALPQGRTTQHEEARSYRGFNFFNEDDEALFRALARGEFTISGVQNKALRARFPQYNRGQMSRVLRRLRTHGLIKKASHCYKYYLTVLGRQTVALGLKLKELVIIPELAATPSR